MIISFIFIFTQAMRLQEHRNINKDVHAMSTSDIKSELKLLSGMQKNRSDHLMD